MITNELIHSARRANRRALILKLDFCKAYDSISWEYLDQIQQMMGFGVKWRQWILECISTPKLAVVVNGSPIEEFSMERGLRQGNPLSPFLFLMVAEGLSRLLSKAKDVGDLRGVELVRNGERMNHLQYPDDTVIFCEAEMVEIKALRRILKSFEASSGLRINYSKSKCVGIGVKEIELRQYAQTLGCDTGQLLMEYLGIPVGADPGRLKTWAPVIDKFKEKLASWRSSTLSMAGRLVLVKAALSNLPVYYASLFKMPVQVVAQLERLQRRFLWGSSEKGRKIHYFKWEKLQRPKAFGGLGIQGMAEKNSSLLARWWWRLVSSRDGLWRRMILEKYSIKDCHNLEEVNVQERKASKPWRDILRVVKGNSEVGLAFREGMQVKLGNGNTLRFWDDTWLGDRPLKVSYKKLWSLALNKKAKVKEMGFWAEGNWLWQLKFRRSLYQWEEVKKDELLCTLCHVQLKDEEVDHIVWTHSEDGRFGVNTLMKDALEIKRTKNKWDTLSFQVWSGLAPPKEELLVWRLYHESLPMKESLYRKGVLSATHNLNCDICNQQVESADHLLLQCSWSWQLWSWCILWWGSYWVVPLTMRELLQVWVIPGTTKTYKRFWKTLSYAIIWTIWEERNKRYFSNQRRSIEEAGEMVKTRLAWWIKYRNSGSPYSLTTIRRCIEEVRRS
ncbi:hypothetical protein QQ045_018759 [Rhodiola kirilowii]